MQLQVQYPDLQQTFGHNSLFSTLYGMNQQDQAQANAQQNLSQAQQEQQFQAEQHPYDIQNLQANIRHTNALAGNTEAMIPGTQASSNLKTREDLADSLVPMDQKVNQAISHIAANISGDQLKAAEDHVWLGMQSPDPQVRAQAQAAMVNIKSIKEKQLELQQQGQNSARVAGIQAGAEIKREQMGIDAGKYAKNSLDYLKYKSMTGNYQQQAGYWTAQAAQDGQNAAQASSQEERDFYSKRAALAGRLADLARASGRDEKAAAAYQTLAKSPEVQQFGIAPVVPQSNVGPQAGSTAGAVNPQAQPTPAPQGDTVVVKKNGVTATIPKDKLEAAQKAGWTQ